MRQSRVTIQDIAQLVGCSKGTVSLALNGRPGVAASTTARVVQAAEQLGYRPNLIAKRLFSKKTGIIGALFHDISGFFMAQNLRGINEVAAARGYSVILSVSERMLDRECEMLDLFVGEQVDGVVLCTTAPLEGGAHLEEFKRQQIPFVLVDRYLANVDTDYVVTDNEVGAYELVTHLIESGHRRIGLVITDESVSSIADRAAGYRRALGHSGIPVDDRLIKRVSLFSHQGLTQNMDSLYGALDELMEETPRLSALVTMSSDLTLGALGWFAQRGIRMPEEVTLAAFDQIPMLSAVGIQLTTVTQAPFEMGCCATRLLLETIDGKEGIEGKIKIPSTLIQRADCENRKGYGWGGNQTEETTGSADSVGRR